MNIGATLIIDIINLFTLQRQFMLESLSNYINWSVSCRWRPKAKCNSSSYVSQQKSTKQKPKEMFFFFLNKDTNWSNNRIQDLLVVWKFRSFLCCLVANRLLKFQWNLLVLNVDQKGVSWHQTWPPSLMSIVLLVSLFHSDYSSSFFVDQNIIVKWIIQNTFPSHLSFNRQNVLFLGGREMEIELLNSSEQLMPLPLMCYIVCWLCNDSFVTLHINSHSKFN